LLRRALGDNFEDTHLIATITRKGYQFAEDVVFSGESGSANQAKQVRQRVADTPGLRREQKPPIGPRVVFLRTLAAAALMVVGGISVWRYEFYRHQITLAPTDTIVLADADNRTSDSVFDGALNTALRYEFEQTPYLNLLGLDKSYSTLGLLKIPPTSKITPDVARQICTRTNSKMVIADSISDAGNGYHVEIKALDCGSGASLAAEGTDISSRNQIVHELGVTAARLRKKLGEPAESLARFNQPLELATSSSLEALQTGNEAVKIFLDGNPQAALPMFQKEAELDPNLALNYEGIGAANQALYHFDLMEASWKRAYELRDRMAEKNRLNVEFLYYNSVTGELDKAYSVLLRALQLFPRDVFFNNNMGVTLRALGQLNRAADLENEAARLESSALYFYWAAAANISASRFKEARSCLARAEALKFDSPELRIQRFRLAFIEGDRCSLDRIFEGEARGPNRAFFLHQQAIFEGHRGRFDSADRLRVQAATLSDQDQISQGLVLSALRSAEAGRAIQTRKIQDQALQRKLERNDKMMLALSLARAGRTDEANRLADELSQEAP
jgi:tetratricopeptide (TPR) repeat protein